MIPTSTFDHLLERVRTSVPRLTKGKRAVLTVLFHADRPMTAQEIFAALEQNTTLVGTIDLATVYRNVEHFEKINIVSRSEHSQFGWRYTLTQKHYAHVVACVQCGKEVPVGACAMAEVDRIIAERTGFTNIHHIVNFTGACPACQSPSTA
jgi:Fur family transcriptional regulator, ferric uptake regulator